jgi:hypothetical protein
MFRNSIHRPSVACLVMLVGFLLACNLSGSDISSAVSGTQTAAAAATSAVGTALAKLGGSPGAQTDAPAPNDSIPPTDTTQPTNTTQPSDTPQPSPTFTVAHLLTPGTPSGASRTVTDLSSLATSAERRAAGGEAYQLNRFERPFFAEGMEYLPDVDLIGAKIKIAAPWVYATLTLAGERPAGIGQTLYGVEFDTNRDGRGEFLIWGASPAGSAWTSDGVQVWKDSNHDVGGPTPVQSDAPWTNGDGYEEKLFDSGQGADPDLAWIRKGSAQDTIEIAFKYAAIGSSAQFFWNALADAGLRNPAWLDYNDRFTPADAGSPLIELTDFYPLQQLFALDNTCRDFYGFTPTGDEPGLCKYVGGISGTVFRDVNKNGAQNSGDYGMGSITITLGQGACPASGYKSASTGSSGGYAFSGLSVGTYCVAVVPPPFNTASSPNPVTVVLAPGQNKVVNFGLVSPDLPE